MTKYFVTTNSSGQILVVMENEIGDHWWLGAGDQDQQYLAWLAEGNTPEPWEAQDAN